MVANEHVCNVSHSPVQGFGYAKLNTLWDVNKADIAFLDTKSTIRHTILYVAIGIYSTTQYWEIP